MTPEENAVVKAAYHWRYALVTDAGEAVRTEAALVEAVDEWDVNRPHDDNGGPLPPAAPAPDPDELGALRRKVMHLESAFEVCANSRETWRSRALAAGWTWGDRR